MRSVPLCSGERDFVRLLQKELASRCARNPKYSLRAFAKALGISPAYLSHLLSGRRKLTLKSLRTLGLRLGLSPENLEGCIEHWASAHGGGAALLSGAREQRLAEIARDRFEVISDWHHFAILEMTRLADFRPDAKWIARALGLTLAESKAAIGRLERLGLIEIGPKGNWVLAQANHTTLGSDEFTTLAHRKMQSQILERAIQALEEIPLSERDQSSLTLALDRRQLPELRERIKSFRRSLLAFQETSERVDQIYQLSFACFPVLKPQKNPSPSKVRK